MQKRDEKKFKQSQHESWWQDLYHKWQELRIGTKEDKVIKKKKINKHPKKLQELSSSTDTELSGCGC